jgi:hypothetical protein
MLNLEENFFLIRSYVLRDDAIIKILTYSTGVVVFLENLRSQLPEIDLLQLIPGFYLIFLLTSFLILVFFSAIFLQIPNLIEIKKGFGIKTLARMKLSNFFRIFFIFFFSLISISLNTIIPISLESFNSYGEKTLENFWSFNEVINIEIFLLFSLIFVSQFPILSSVYLKGEKNLKKLPKIWRFISFLSAIFAGFATPTVDGYTQLSFSIVIIFMYFLLMVILEKRIILKFKGFLRLGF